MSYQFLNDLAELTRRVAALEARLAAIQAQPPPTPPRLRGRPRKQPIERGVQHA